MRTPSEFAGRGFTSWPAVVTSVHELQGQLGSSSPLEPQGKQRTGLLTLLFTDVAGSTQLKAALGDQSGVTLIQSHHALVRELLMALYARALGVPPGAVFAETNALHSSENLTYSYQIARRFGWEKVAVASDSVQTPHLRRLARKFEIPVAFLPVDFVCLSRITKPNPQVDTSAAYVPKFLPMKAD